METSRALRRFAVERPLLKDIVREQIRDAILDGTFQPGETLHDSELTEWLEVSRTPLRAAINDLARVGLIDTWPNRYTRVAARTASSLEPSLRALAILNGGAVLLSVPKLSPRARRELGRFCDDLIAAIDARAHTAVRNTFMALFREALAHTDNPVYRRGMTSDLDGLYFQAPIDAIVRAVPTAQLTAMTEATDALKRAISANEPSHARDAAEAMHVVLLRPSVELPEGAIGG
ncbi:GntR family transcriptional regulator [Leifsonia aquatica]|uniref:GntR family transcriptional regulator n=1 Tax=Leifsonia aquatica TaxID=144185 RepID=UPI0004692EDE|nr:GntR family transcriptional regulator [Leifsonia aquatica]